MTAKARVDWSVVELELVDHKKQGKSHRDFLNFLFAKYGVSLTQARISQKVKELKQRGLL